MQKLSPTQVYWLLLYVFSIKIKEKGLLVPSLMPLISSKGILNCYRYWGLCRVSLSSFVWHFFFGFDSFSFFLFFSIFFSVGVLYPSFKESLSLFYAVIFIRNKIAFFSSLFFFLFSLLLPYHYYWMSGVLFISILCILEMHFWEDIYYYCCCFVLLYWGFDC